MVKYDINIFIDPTLRFTDVTIKCHQHVDKKYQISRRHETIQKWL